MTTDSVSDERLGELITSHQLEQHSWLRQDQQAPLDYESQAAAYQCQDTLSGLRELRTYRKLVREYLDMLDDLPKADILYEDRGTCLANLRAFTAGEGI